MIGSLAASCAFHRGEVRPGDASDIDAPVQSVGDAPGCTAPIVIDDHFDNGDLATAGPSSKGSGFLSVTNASTGNGSSVELLGAALEIRTANNAPPVAPAQGAVSNTSFAFDPAGMTVRLEVSAADTPIWNGIALALQSNAADLDHTGGSLVLRIRGQGTNPSNVDMGDQAPYATPLGLQPYDEAALADGFVVTWRLDASSWSYVGDGMRANGTSIVGSGGYPGGERPADLFGPAVHLGIHIQGNPDDANPRVLRVNRLTLWDGICP